MPAQRVDVHGLLLDQQFTDLVQLSDRLLLDGLDRNKTHRRPGHCLADGLGIGCVVLVPLDIGLDVLGRDQADLVSKLGQLTAPMMGAATGFHANQARWQAGEEGLHLGSGQLLAQDRSALCIGTVNLKPALGQIEPDSCDPLHGRSPLRLRSSHPAW